MNTYLKGTPNYDKYPFVELADSVKCHVGWNEITDVINKEITQLDNDKKVIVIDCYQGVIDEQIVPHISKNIDAKVHLSSDAFLSEKEIDTLVYPDVTDDDIFGYLTRLKLPQFFDHKKIENIQKAIAESEEQVHVVYGVGALLVYPNPDVVLYADMARWEIQQRFRRNEVSNLGVCNPDLKTSLQYKRAYFVDWRVLDKHKKDVMNRWNYVLDLNDTENPKMLRGESVLDGYKQTVNQPFRVVPFFDPGPWGGQWMKEYCDLDKEEANFAWCFDCVPEENSLLLKAGDELFETPSINVVFSNARALLGNAVQARFGDEFPIRFDFLDTMQGGNLSLQVHPSTEYIQEEFGMRYTQDESYYMLDAGEEAHVYLGLKEGVDTDEMRAHLEDAQNGGALFDAEKFVEKWDVKKHDHILIPAGTVHCSGKDSMVLEISATPYIFTFKLWDWGRLGLDGLPRPINIDRGMKVIDESRTTENVKNELINAVTTISEGDGWREERTGLHEREFIETRRHWFTKKVLHKTEGSVNVLNLIEGQEAIIESPTNSFKPYVVHYAETFIIPEKVKEYTISPYGKSEGSKIATLKAFVRINP